MWKIVFDADFEGNKKKNQVIKIKTFYFKENTLKLFFF